MIDIVLYDDKTLTDVTLEYNGYGFSTRGIIGCFFHDEYDIGGDIWVEEGNTLEIGFGTIRFSRTW